MSELKDMEKRISIRDTDDIKNIFVQLDMKRGKVMVMSNFSAWENLAFLMEALEVTAQTCIEEGIDKDKVYQEIHRYLATVSGTYTFIQHGKTAKKHKG